MKVRKILYVTATQAEAEALIRVPGIVQVNAACRLGGLDIHLLTAGVGSPSTIYNMCKWIFLHGKPDLAINTGIAGSFSERLEPGAVVFPVSDCFADLGIDDNGKFLTLPEAGLADPEEIPFTNGMLKADNYYSGKIGPYAEGARAITVNTATGSAAKCELLRGKYNPDIETMEGAAFFYICLRESIPFFGLRAISNIVEPRNRKSWNIELALKNLSLKLEEILLTL